MNHEKFIQPREIQVKGRTFIISQIPSIEALPIHSVVAKSVMDNGVMGMTMLPTATDKAILSYTAVRDTDGMVMSIDNDNVINHVFNGHFQDLKEVVAEMIKENFSFLITGDLLDKLVVNQEATESGS